MIWLAWLYFAAMLLGGMFLSAFFSGSETGFYRATRVRLLLDALGGDQISRGLLWLINRPSFFVATTLVGNNVANYITSLAIVLITRQVVGSGREWAEMLAPILASPLVFVYGESLPKNLYYHAPNLLLRRGGLLFLLFTVLFSPVALVLWLLGRGLQSLLGESPVQVQLKLARKELEQVLDEGQEAGILLPAQRSLAQNLFAVANRPVAEICTPVARVASVRLGTRTEEVLRLARRHRLAAVPVTRTDSRALEGYVRVIDLRLSQAEIVAEVRPLTTIPHRETHVGALLELESHDELLARVVDEQGQTIGLITAQQLNEPLFR